MRQCHRHICLLLTAFAFALAGACAASARTPEGASSASAPSSRAWGHFTKGSKVSRFVFGAEWGYTSSLFNIYHNNYLSPEGIRVDEKGVNFDYYSNGHVLAGVGYAFARKYEVGAYLGFIGVAQERRLVPLSLRATYYFDSYLSDGLFCYLDGGPAFGENQNVTLIGKIGGGYRVKLSNRFSLDFLLSFHICSDHPKIFNSDDQQITGDDLRRNDATYGGLNFTLALRF